MGHNRSDSRLIRQGNANLEIKRLYSKLLRILPCDNWLLAFLIAQAQAYGKIIAVDPKPSRQMEFRGASLFPRIATKLTSSQVFQDQK